MIDLPKANLKYSLVNLQYSIICVLSKEFNKIICRKMRKNNIKRLTRSVPWSIRKDLADI